MSWNKETVYDEQIQPLMKQIIGICKENSIPFVAKFQYCNLPIEEGGRVGHVRTVILPEGKEIVSQEMRELALVVQPPKAHIITETHVTLPNGKKQIRIGNV